MIELSTISQTKWCKPTIEVDPIYMSGRAGRLLNLLRPESDPHHTVKSCFCSVIVFSLLMLPAEI